jgi:hypothetical protein
MTHVRKALLSLLGVTVVLFAIAAIVGQHPKEHWKDILGGIAWFGFLACVLLLILLGVAWIVHAVRHRKVSA